MAGPKRRPVHTSDGLVRAVADAHAQANAALEQLSRQNAPDARAAGQAGQSYRCPGDAAPRNVPAVQLLRPYSMGLKTLEFSLYGYRLRLPFGWERREETVFHTGLPPLWRRALSAPLLELRVCAEPHQTSVIILPSSRARRPRGAGHIFRLDPELQRQLEQAYNGHPRRSIGHILSGWYRRFIRNRH